MSITHQDILILLFALILPSCREKVQHTDSDVLVKVGNASLSRQMLDNDIPFGLSQNDSTKFAHNYIHNWIETKLMTEIASKNVDMSEITRMVENYQNDLIIWEYCRQMYDENALKEFSSDSLALYYEKHKDQFKLQYPLVKGIYIKIEDNAPNLTKLRQWYRSNKSEDIEKLEKYGLTGAIHYDYFRDQWIDWEQIESKIPFDFGNNPDAFLKANRNVDISSGGFTYLLDITEYLPSNTIMPFDVAQALIKEQLINQNRLQYERDLHKSLYDKAVKEGKVEIFCDIDL